MRKQWKQWLYIWGLQKSLQMVIAAMKLKDTWSLEEKPWQTESILKSRGITLRTSVHLVKGMVFSSVQFSHSVVSDSLWPHESQHARPPCPLPTIGIHSNSRPLSRWCHPAISSSVVPFSSRPQSLQASESFPMSQLFAWGGQSTEMQYLDAISKTSELSLFVSKANHSISQ